MDLPQIPSGWTVRGQLPDVNPQTADEDQLELLDEDLLQIIDPTGAMTLDVGWYPAASRSGAFVCRAVISDQWDEPVVELETQSSKNVSEWLEKWIADSRQTEPATLSQMAVALVLVRTIVRPIESLETERPSRVARSTTSLLWARTREDALNAT